MQVRDSLRILIRAKLADGRLPRDGIPRVWGRPGNGETCVACEAEITRSNFMMEGVGEGLRAVQQFHIQCFYVWDSERDAPGGTREAIAGTRPGTRRPCSTRRALRRRPLGRVGGRGDFTRRRLRTHYRYGSRSRRKSCRGRRGLGLGLHRRRDAGDVPDGIRQCDAGNRRSARPLALVPAQHVSTNRSASTTCQSQTGILLPRVVTFGAEVIARCQGCGVELQDPTQRFCGGDRCLQVLMRWPEPPWPPKARASSLSPT
jgi:hypothetical protein